MPPGSDVVSLANEVGDFFADKVSRMHAALDGNSGAVDDDGLEDGNCPVSFERFNILSPEDVRDLICWAAISLAHWIRFQLPWSLSAQTS